MSRPRTRTIRTDYLARVEGEGAMMVRVRDGAVTGVEFRIFEPPRLFEAFLRGRAFGEAPDITARVCGICPVAYQMSSVQAMEEICGVEVGEQLRGLRRLLYCGEWLESHALHVFLLHLPDFLGYASAIEMARDHGDLVQRGLDLKKAGNEVMTLIGGREVHPINVRVGGFYRVPTRRELAPLREKLERARETALEAVRFTASLDFPAYERDYELVSLSQAGEYPIERGRIVSNRGLDIAVAAYDEHFVEEQVPWSNALHSRLRERGPYLVGPLARYALNAGTLSPLAREAAKEAGLEPSERNPFRSIVVRCVEMVYAADEALRLLGEYAEPERPAVEVEPRAGVGHGCTEAPRGILYHRYEVDREGTILEAKIVPPTSQNQRVLEDDLRGVVDRFLELPDDALSLRLEQTIRNYDPCISCAAHFLKLEVRRS
jgi:coenzyme F420-reducing hydrogenase alpha subunit